MTTVELLQQIGLNKYEAEAYYALLVHGAMTGYEVGKRSNVPLSRSYEVLERLTEKGLAQVQPGDPPRYQAQNPHTLLGQVRTTMETTLQALSISLTALAQTQQNGEFWVVRNREPITRRIVDMLNDSYSRIDLIAPDEFLDEISTALQHARERHCYVNISPLQEQTYRGLVGVLCDKRYALIGSLFPAEQAQVMVSTHVSLTEVLHGYFTYLNSMPALPITTQQAEQRDWLAWEERKQKHLHDLSNPSQVA